MDPFARLPAEIQLQIILSLDSLIEVMRLSHASPTMMHQRQASEAAIEWSLCRQYLQGNLLQDAMAIILFPDPSRKDHRISDQFIMDNWQDKSFPDPFEERNFPRIMRLGCLISRVKQYMEDCISKATSPNFPEFYFLFPKWTHPTLAPRGLDGEHRMTSHNLPLNSLTVKERDRLLCAFLRHELLCKLNPPNHKLPRLSDIATNAWPGYFDHGYSQPALEDYEERSSERFRKGPIKKGNRIYEDFRDRVMVLCVHEYFRSLYTGLAARLHQPGWFFPTTQQRNKPSEPDTKSDMMAAMKLDADFLLPADLHAERDRYFDSCWTSVPGCGYDYSKTYDGQLAACGLDLLTTLLTQRLEDTEKFLHDFYHEVWPSTTVSIELAPIGPLRTTQRRGNQDANRDQRQRRIMKICRQRAWALFDDGRLYPEYCDFSRVYNDPLCQQRFWEHYDKEDVSSLVPRRIESAPPLKRWKRLGRLLRFPSMRNVRPVWIDECTPYTPPNYIEEFKN